jgi:hypothetical protein
MNNHQKSLSKKLGQAQYLREARGQRENLVNFIKHKLR